MNAASTTFVDDLATTVVAQHSPAALRPTVEFINTELDLAIATHNLAQNTTKAMSIASCRGKGSRDAFKVMQADPNIGIVHHARYLGPQMAWNGSLSVEIKIRIRQSWGCFLHVQEILV